MATQGVVIASSGDVVPDKNGAPIHGQAFVNFDSPVVDDSGRVAFRGQIQGAGVVSLNEHAYFYGTSRADLKMQVRSGEQAPGMPAGVLLSLAPDVQITANGLLYWGGWVWDRTAMNGIGPANDEVIWGGPCGGAQTIQIREGSTLPLPAGPGTTWRQVFSSAGFGYTGMNVHGAIFFLSKTTGGDTNTTAGMNNELGFWGGLPASLEQVARRSNPINGLAGAVAIDTSGQNVHVAQINSANQLLYEMSLSTTQTVPPALPTSDRVYMVHTLGGSGTKLVREGDDAPGTFNGVGFATFNTIAGSASEGWAAALSPTCWTRSGKFAFTTTLRGGDVVATLNDKAVYTGDIGSVAIAVRKGDSAPGTDGVFSDFLNFGTVINDSGRICIRALISGGTVSAANDTGIWAGFPGALQLVAREGQTMPGTGGSTLSLSFGDEAFYNDTNRVCFKGSLPGVGPTWWNWSPLSGLQLLFVGGDWLEVQPTVFKQMANMAPWAGLTNGDGAPGSWSHTGHLVTAINMADGSRVLVRLFLGPETSTTSLCLGDGTGIACPCANNSSSPGSGCASPYFGGQGATLTASGYAGASAGTDTLTLTATNIPGPGMFFQAAGAPSPVNFGDGHLCVPSNIVRLGVVFSSGGMATYPGGLAPTPIHAAGVNMSGDTRTYQCWYRTSPSLCSLTVQFNLTQGLQLTWGP